MTVQYLVHLERTGMFDWNISITHRERRVALNYLNGRHGDIKQVTDMDDNNPGSCESWYTHSLEHAELLAEEIARQNPGRKVNVYTLQSVTTCPPGKPTKAKWSEKGLLPE